MTNRPTPHPANVAAVGIARATRVGTPADVVAAHRELTAAKLLAHIQTALAAEFPMTDKRRRELADLIAGGAR